jgi:hypothetical protein
MRAGLLVSGVLGLGTAIVFGAAALVAVTFPNGTTVSAGWTGGDMMTGGAFGGPVMVKRGIAIPMPAPAVPVPVNLPGSGFGSDGGQLIVPETAPPQR